MKPLAFILIATAVLIMSDRETAERCACQGTLWEIVREPLDMTVKQELQRVSEVDLL